MKNNSINEDPQLLNEYNEISLAKYFGKGKTLDHFKTNNCVIYTRVSSKEQADNNMSLNTQDKACELYAQKNGYNILGKFGGTYESAKNDERKEFNKMLAFVKKSKEKITYIIVYSVDRFSRSGGNAIYITEQLKKQGVNVVSVTQPTDASTPSGSLQQNIQYIFSEYDNQLRREKCMSGVKEALLRGDWCNGLPLGYDTIKINGKRTIVANEKGKLIGKAFLWKANQNLSNEECREKLKDLGFKLSHQQISKIFKNPFYCGLIAHNALEGQLVKGNHEKVVSQDVFLKVNDIQSKNPHGYKHNNEETNVPMKVFLKCGHCNRSLTGYVVKAKGIWYYKCKTIGCSNNKSAKELHHIFEFILSRFSLNPQLQDLVKRNLLDTIAELNKESEFAKNSLKEQIVEVSKKIERTEERYMEEEITQDLFTKFMTKYKAEKLNLLKEYNKMDNNSSNHEILVENALEFACNLSKTWANGDFQTKTNLQYYLFPDGLSYSKVLNEVRTNKINPFFSWIALQQQVLDDKKSGIPELNIKYSALVVSEGVEPPTS